MPGQSFAQFAVRKFGNHDGSVHQHTYSKDQAEQHHDIE